MKFPRAASPPAIPGARGFKSCRSGGGRVDGERSAAALGPRPLPALLPVLLQGLRIGAILGDRDPQRLSVERSMRGVLGQRGVEVHGVSAG